MIADVATADVVVTNPTHFAVALRYDGTEARAGGRRQGRRPGRRGHPRGRRGRRRAGALEPAARARAPQEVEIGQMIPDEFFAAVAEVLAFVYRTAAPRRRRAARSRPRHGSSRRAERR